MLEQLRLMARYNRWMNEKLFIICSEIPDIERKRDRAAPFRSIHGTFNHLLVADKIWLGRFTRQPFAAQSLDQELYSDFDELWKERSATDAAIETWLTTLSEVMLEGNLTFTPLSYPGERTIPMKVCTMHVFNHQTHHRGQITVMIEQAGYDCGVTDLAAMP